MSPQERISNALTELEAGIRELSKGQANCPFVYFNVEMMDIASTQEQAWMPRIHLKVEATTTLFDADGF